MAAGEPKDANDPPSATPVGVTVVSGRSARAKARASKRPTASADSSSAHEASPSGHASVRTGLTPISATQRADVLAKVLLGDELRRAHVFSASIAAISGGVLAALPLLDGDPSARRLCAAALLCICLSSLWVFTRTRPKHTYQRVVHRIYGVVITTGVVAVEYYMGVFSPVTLVVTLGAYFLGQASDPFQAIGLTSYVTVSYVLLAVLVTLEVVPDVGLLDASGATLSSHVFAIIAVTTVIALTVRMARMSRRSMQDAIERSNEALMAAQQREALLVEAQQQLERALHVAIGKPGIHSGQLAGPYRLGNVIGVGAMGEIYEAKHEPDGTPAAVKLMQAGTRGRDDLVHRFMREAAICQRLDSPHVVRVLQAGAMEDGTSYMAMELLAGTDLAAHLRKHGAMPLRDVVQLARDMASGLSAAHAAGVVHRDLKPVNVFRCEDASTGAVTWKILDFGISKLADSTGTLTNVGIVGTPGYMSPEQAQGQHVDLRSDVFSMATVLYRALTGRPAFSGADTPQIMFEVVYRSPMQPSVALAGVPVELDTVFAIGLAKQPDQRWSTATELADAVELASQGKLRSDWKARARKLLKTQPWGQPIKTG